MPARPMAFLSLATIAALFATSVAGQINLLGDPACADPSAGLRACPEWFAVYDDELETLNEQVVASASGPDGGVVYQLLNENEYTPNANVVQPGALHIPARLDVDVGLRAIDASTGAQLFSVTHEGEDALDLREWLEATSIAASPDGSSIVISAYPRLVSTDNGVEPVVSQAPIVISYDADGNERWNLRQLTHMQFEAQRVAYSPDSSTVYVAGRAKEPQPSIIVAAVDAETGYTKWSYREDRPHLTFAYGSGANDLVVSGDGNTLVLAATIDSYGSHSFYMTENALVMALDADTGALQWRHQHAQVEGSDTAVAVAIEGDRVISVRNTLDFSSGLDQARHTGYNLDGGWILWDETLGYQDPSNPEETWASSLAIDKANGRYIVGATVARGDPAHATRYVGVIAYDLPDGAHVWRQDYTNQVYQQYQVLDIAITDDGRRVFVAVHEAAGEPELYNKPAGHVSLLAIEGRQGRDRSMTTIDGPAIDAAAGLELGPGHDLLIVSGTQVYGIDSTAAEGDAFAAAFKTDFQSGLLESTMLTN